jgi:ATP-dependent DNA helicase DinG
VSISIRTEEVLSKLPGYEVRDGQLAMAKAVGDAFARDRHLFVEAGTGTGKTLAYLVPAILSGKKIVVSTATKALQEQIFEKDLPFAREVLAEHGVETRIAVMKGLGNYLCKRRLAAADPVPLGRIARWASESQTGDRSELDWLDDGSPLWRDVQSGSDTRIGAGCTYHDECFVTKMKRDAEAAQIVVVNHHLFFADLALRTAKTGFGAALPAYDAVVFDEAHQIETVATEFFGVRVSTSRIDSLVRDARRALFAAKVLDSSSMAIVDGVETAAYGFFRGFTGDEARRTLGASDWTRPRRDALAALDAALEALASFALANDRHESIAVLARRAGDLRGDLARVHASAPQERHWVPDDEELAHAVKPFEGSVLWLETRGANVALGASPVDVGPILRERLFDRVPSVVMTSATLATSTHAGPSFHFAKGRLGAHAETTELVVASPFDFQARAILYTAEDLPEPTEPGFDEACADRAAELVAITGGGAFVLCTSTRAMKSIHASLSGRVPGPLFVQGQAPKHVLLERFRASGSATLVATMSFWEGVDVPGRALRLVVIDKIPFAVPTDPLVAARCKRIEQDGGNPFSEYSVPSAAITLKQGFGRLVRTKKDAGVVALLDRRAVRRGYGKSLLSSLPPARRTTSLEGLREMWWELDH